MDILEWVIVSLILLFGLAMPYPSGSIGKKTKKGITWARPILSIIYYRFYVKGELAESFFDHVEEFQNFVDIGYTPAFPSMYRELLEKSQFSQIERKHIDKETGRIQETYLRIKRVQKLKRKNVFKQTVRDFKELIEDVSKMARNIGETIRTKFILLNTLGQTYVDNYRFSAREFNNFLRYFRRFLDKTYCSHGVEIEHFKLLDLLVPEELPFMQEKVKKL